MERGAKLIRAVMLGDDAGAWRFADRESVGYADERGYQAMHWAAIDGNLPVMRMMHSHHGAALEAATFTGRRPLHFASENGHVDVVLWLVFDRRVERDASTRAGLTPADLASINREARVGEVLALGQRVFGKKTGRRRRASLVEDLDVDSEL